MTDTAIPVAVIVMTRNEAANLDACLGSVGGRFAQRFVVDSDSEDDTCAIANAHGATIVRFRWNGRYPKKKQWCLENLPFQVDWALYVDADERLTPDLIEEIARTLKRSPREGAFWIKAHPVFLGKILRHGLQNRKLALVNRHRVRFPVIDDLDVASMWEVEGHYQPCVDGPIGDIGQAMIHDDRKPLFHWLERHNRYSDWEARLLRDGRKSRLGSSESPRRRLVHWLARNAPVRHAAAFLHCYIIRLGFLDGLEGLHYAISRSVYHWLIQVKIHELKRQDRRTPQ